MNVEVTTTDGRSAVWEDAEVTFDKVVLQITNDADETTTFPLANVISFTTSDPS